MHKLSKQNLWGIQLKGGLLSFYNKNVDEPTWNSKAKQLFFVVKHFFFHVRHDLVKVIQLRAVAI